MTFEQVKGENRLKGLNTQSKRIDGDAGNAEPSRKLVGDEFGFIYSNELYRSNISQQEERLDLSLQNQQIKV